MRSLSLDEKILSDGARKKANKQLADHRKSLSLKLKMLKHDSPQRPILLRRIDAIRDIKGLPVNVSLKGGQMVLNYEMYRRFIRLLKGRQMNIKIDRSTGDEILVISHSTGYSSKDFGKIEFYNLPHYQTELLDGLPVVEID